MSTPPTDAVFSDEDGFPEDLPEVAYGKEEAEGGESK